MTIMTVFADSLSVHSQISLQVCDQKELHSGLFSLIDGTPFLFSGLVSRVHILLLGRILKMVCLVLKSRGILKFVLIIKVQNFFFHSQVGKFQRLDF